MLKLKKKKNSEVKYDAVTDEADDTQKFIEDFIADLFKTNPDLADKLAGPLLTKSALDSALDNGVYRMNDDEVLLNAINASRKASGLAALGKEDAKKSPTPCTSKGRGKNNKSKKGLSKGLKKPHTSI